MIFQRGVEGIMICPSPTVKPTEDWLVCSTLVHDDNDPITVWLSKYGLAEREIQAVVVLRRLSEENRDTIIKGYERDIIIYIYIISIDRY